MRIESTWGEQCELFLGVICYFTWSAFKLIEIDPMRPPLGTSWVVLGVILRLWVLWGRPGALLGAA